MIIHKTVEPKKPDYGMIHPDFEVFVQKIIQSMDSVELAEARRDFHTRLRLTLTQPDNSELVEDLWDFFYDWCVFEQHMLEKSAKVSEEEISKWKWVTSRSVRSAFTLTKVSDTGIKLKDLFSGKSYWVPKSTGTDFLGMSRSDIVEGRLMPLADNNEKEYCFVRRPSYHPIEVHGYIKTRVKQFKKSQDYSSYQSWLWILVGMYLKHRIYSQMPIEKIYDDNSRI